jgi:D-alanine-D-alanine ligase
MSTKSKKNIAVISGGFSSEFYISLKSGEAIASNIDKEKYNVYSVQIKKDEWILTNDLNCGIIINKNDFSFSDNGQKTKFDCVVSAIHGTPGEDGLLQGYFDMLDIPYVGSGVLTSSITFNKFYCNNYLRNFKNINISDSVLITKGQNIDTKNIIEKVGLPCFVKPNAGGSSFGVTKAKKEEDIIPAIETAFKESDQVIIERFAKGDEIQCGIFKIKGKEYKLPLVEIVSKNEFFDYQAKYDPNFCEEIIPARISEELTLKCQKITSEIYDALHCKGIVRMDFILKDNEFWFLEVNTIPGMTNESLVPQMIKKSGMTIKEVMTILIEDTLNNEISI